jgi:pyruvate ferredoxin oxidoreductase alpha subunit
MDRSDSMNANEGPVCLEVKSALFDNNIKVETLNYIYGLGGREIRPEDIESVYRDLGDVIKGKKKDKITYLGVRE